VSITATCRLEWNNQLSKSIMLFSLPNIEYNDSPGRHLMGVLECHQLIPPKNCRFFWGGL
jgi:hypothetical protein